MLFLYILNVGTNDPFVLNPTSIWRYIYCMYTQTHTHKRKISFPCNWSLISGCIYIYIYILTWSGIPLYLIMTTFLILCWSLFTSNRDQQLCFTVYSDPFLPEPWLTSSVIWTTVGHYSWTCHTHQWVLATHHPISSLLPFLFWFTVNRHCRPSSYPFFH